METKFVKIVKCGILYDVIIFKLYIATSIFIKIICKHKM